MLKKLVHDDDLMSVLKALAAKKGNTTRPWSAEETETIIKGRALGIKARVLMKFINDKFGTNRSFTSVRSRMDRLS